jgi:hypothetical protein
LEGKRIKKAENTAYFAPFGRAISPARIFIFFLLFLTKTASDLTSAPNRSQFRFFSASRAASCAGAFFLPSA